MLRSSERIQMMERSLRCFAFGLLGLLPGIGAAFAALAVGLFFSTRIQAADEWNPASAYLNWGLGFAVYSLFQTLCLMGFVLVNLLA